VRGQGVVDDLAQGRGVPRRLQQREAERAVQLVRAQVPRETEVVRQPDLADQRPLARVLVGDRKPAGRRLRRQR